MLNIPRPSRLRSLVICVPLDDASESKNAAEKIRCRLGAMFPRDEPKLVYRREECERDRLVATIEEWVRRAPADLPHLLFFFGHGGAFEFRGRGRRGPRGVVYGLECSDTDLAAAPKKKLLLDIELSAALTRLASKCGNVTAIIDACYSRRTVRNAAHLAYGSVQTRIPGDWVLRTYEIDFELAAESHPRIVRLTATSSRRIAWADWGASGWDGRLTETLLEQLEQLGTDWWQLSWDTLVHAVRERLIESESSESQWIALAGPRHRLLFSEASVTSPRTVGLVRGSTSYWIRAGKLTGVVPGDRWAVAKLLTRGGRPCHFACRATDIACNRARLVGLGKLFAGEDRPVAAFVERAHDPMPVYMDDDLHARFELNRTTAWLTRASAPDGHHVLRATDGGFELIAPEGTWPTVRIRADEREPERDLVCEVKELLEDRARTQRLQSVEPYARKPPAGGRSPIRWQIGLDPSDSELSDRRLRPGSRLWVRVYYPERKRSFDHNGLYDPRANWFASVVMVDPIGRPLLLNGAEVDGIELEQDDEAYIGRRVGPRRRGLVLEWPKELLAPDLPASVRLILLSSRRPIQLGHLAREMPSSELAAFHMQGLIFIERPRPDPHATRSGATRHRAAPSRALEQVIAESTGWGWDSIELSLLPPTRREV